MPVRRCTLNGLKIRSLDDFYDQVSKQLSLPEHFGRNLDALWDVLSADVEGPFEIVWTHAGDSKKAMDRDYRRIVDVLEDLEDERPDFKLKIEL
jgi:ribonuclease inhibitor